MGVDVDAIKSIAEFFLNWLDIYGWSAYLWLPIVFAAYAKGRGWWGTRLIVIFVLAEIAAVVWMLARFLWMIQGGPG